MALTPKPKPQTLIPKLQTWRRLRSCCISRSSSASSMACLESNSASKLVALFTSDRSSAVNIYTWEKKLEGGREQVNLAERLTLSDFSVATGLIHQVCMGGREGGREIIRNDAQFEIVHRSSFQCDTFSSGRPFDLSHSPRKSCRSAGHPQLPSEPVERFMRRVLRLSINKNMDLKIAKCCALCPIDTHSHSSKQRLVEPGQQSCRAQLQ
jgi:hypothetical protein